ncbi:hypothetical protein K437DRAFT_241154 [Tilletiaria anomala UBC 951]|uniref:CID domain-containing protein n=1 Tax=Tilletiaria anomala (strain ATCC 24038 / CBS 436.72 / UBC 951) TaxID=1037660 RepID=A0A066VD45_TILAU|nr:uncharacterized protein K437DRAFT_241154 [Tilletiaria anomala UBC 951]KDN36510.1 hypothetical protein K437DRAFT_241154 [Tilletiaria anomala UBC 951]
MPILSNLSYIVLAFECHWLVGESQVISLIAQPNAACEWRPLLGGDAACSTNMNYRGAPPPRPRAFDFDDNDAGDDLGQHRGAARPGYPPVRPLPARYDDLHDSRARDEGSGYRRGDDSRYEPSSYHGARASPSHRSSDRPELLRRRNRSPSDSRSPSPDPMLAAFLEATKEDPEEAKKKEVEKKAAFSTGMARKSKFQKEKEEAERKRKTEEAEAAAAYKDFVEAMEGSEPKVNRSRSTHAFIGSGGSSYMPSRPVSQVPSAPRAMRVPATSANLSASNAFGADEDEEAAPVKPQDGQPFKRRRAMDDFASQLKREQGEREQRLRGRVPEGKSISSVLAMEGQRIGSRDVKSDPLTTNVCVLNLPANVTERSLGEFFAQWGDVATVKIMWPRGDEALGGGAGAGITSLRKDRLAGLTGFVAYMQREDAEYALKETDGITWGGAFIKTGWGKAMPLPTRASYTLPLSGRSGRRGRKRSRSCSPDPRFTRSRSRSAEPRRNRSSRPRGRSTSPRAEVRKRIDPESEQARFISAVAERVLQLGHKFEQMIYEKEKDNPRFDFLRNQKLLEHQYFRMLVDDRYEPELPPDPFKDQGLNELYSSDSEEAEEAEYLRKSRRGDVIGRAARRRFEAMLRGITPRRERIARAMRFALEHAHASSAIAELLIESLLIPSTPVPRKLARLYVLSDILHNGAVPLPNAWKYRQAFEQQLPLVFAHLGDVARSFPGRMKQEGFKMQVSAVLDTWEVWLIFTPNLLEQLRQLLEGGGSGVVAAASGASSSEAADAKVDEGREQASVSALLSAGADEDDEVDGEAL